MKKREFLTALAAVAAWRPSKAQALDIKDDVRPTLHGKLYDGPRVTQLLVQKEKRKLYLLHGQEVLKSYPVRLGFNPTGHKLKKGDGRTPEGLYYVDRRNYNSQFHLSLGISYPNARDVARARMAGVTPGGDIFIHGGPRTAKEGRKRDWTAGCIAVSNNHMTEIFWMTELGVPIFIGA